MTYGAGMEFDPKDVKGYIYVAFCLDTFHGKPSWIILADTDEKDLKDTIMDEGYDMKHSFVVKVKVEDVTHVKKSSDDIKTINAEQTGEEKTVQ